MNFGNTLFISVVILLCYCCSPVALFETEVCGFEQYEDEFEILNKPNLLDRLVNFEVNNAQECWLNITDLFIIIDNTYNQDSSITSVEHTVIQNKIIAIKLLCRDTNPIHLLANITGRVTARQKYKIKLTLVCILAVEDIDAFLSFGIIVYLRITENPYVFKIHEKCQYAANLIVLEVQNSCKPDEPRSEKMLFWNSCKRVFAKTTTLFLDLCIDVNTTTLRQKFPNLHTLSLQTISLEGALNFPWTYNGSTRLLIDSVEKETLYNVSSGKYIELYNCQIKQHLLNFTGEIDEILLFGMHFNYIRPDLFHNIVIKSVIDLSENNIQTMGENLFQNQHLLTYLYLQWNKLTYISRGTFRDLQNILTIDLSHNLLKHLHDDVFMALINIKEINLGNNLLITLPENMFKNKTNSLRSLQLSSNPLTDIPIWPLYATNLEMYNLSNARISGESVLRFLENFTQIGAIERELEAQLTLPVRSQSSHPKLFLEFNQIKTIPSTNITLKQFTKLKAFLSSYNVLFHGNPWTCNCDTFIIRTLVTYLNMNDEPTYYSNTFICKYPHEFRGRHMWNITDEEQYCPVTDVNDWGKCPPKCKCFRRKLNETVIIVNCSDIAVGSIPTILPRATLELWFENSNISDIPHVNYLANVTVLNLARNHIKQITPSVINDLKHVQTISLHANNLTSIPIQIRSLSISKLTLSNNPYICDCTVRWMKGWLLNNEARIVDWVNVECLEDSKHFTQLIAVPDSHFVCKSPQNEFDAAKHVFLPSVITGTFLFVFIVLCMICYIFRFNIKVLLFIYFNVHPFDKNLKTGKKYRFYDAILIYVADDNSLIEAIANHLRKRGHEIGDFYTNSFVGYTWIENIDKLTECSNSVILCLPDNLENYPILKAAWTIAYDKLVTSSIHSIILITDKKTTKTLVDTLRLYMRSSNCVDRNASLLLQKLDYLIPFKTLEEREATGLDDSQSKFEVNHDHDIPVGIKRVLISYPDTFHPQIKDKVAPVLSGRNFNVKVLEMLFTAGRDMREELPYILDAAHNVIFIINEETLADEIKLYILTEIVTKAQLENHNYLILCTLGTLDRENMSKELSNYVKNYVTISTNDPEFQNRIIDSLEQRKHREVGRETLEPKQTKRREEVREFLEPEQIKRRAVGRELLEPEQTKRREVVREVLEPEQTKRRAVVREFLEPEQTKRREIVRGVLEPEQTKCRKVVRETLEPEQTKRREEVREFLEPEQIKRRVEVREFLEPEQTKRREVVREFLEPEQTKRREVVRETLDPEMIPLL